MTQFTVGTGGKGFYEIGAKADRSRFSLDDRVGALRLTLAGDGTFDYAFIDASTDKVVDAGTQTCMNGPSAVVAGARTRYRVSSPVRERRGRAPATPGWRAPLCCAPRARGRHRQPPARRACCCGSSGGRQRRRSWQARGAASSSRAGSRLIVATSSSQLCAVGHPHEQHDPGVVVPRLTDGQCFDHLGEPLDLAVDLRGSDPDAAGVQGRV